MKIVLLFGLLLAVGPGFVGAASAQVQPEVVTAGKPMPPGPPETRQQKQLKTAACNKAASRYKLRGSDRKTYLERCMALRYSGKFMPPEWPAK